MLAALGRTHDPANVVTAVRAAREAGFDAFNLDLIYGGVGETVDDWKRTLAAALALEPPHVSAYALTVEAGTPLADDARTPSRRRRSSGQVRRGGSRVERGGTRRVRDLELGAPGSECRHNLLYWSQGSYLGVGCAAHSHREGSRWWNVRTPERYIEAIAAGRSPVGGSETLDAETRRLERLQLALRTRAGVPAEALPDDLDDLVERDSGRVTLTLRGRLLANEVSLRLS